MNAFLTKYLPSRWQSLQVRQRGALIIAIPVSCLLSSLVAVTWMRSNTLAAATQANLTQQKVIQANRLLLLLVEAQTSVRGYGLTGRQEFLKPYEQAKSTLPNTLNILNTLIRENPTQVERFQDIKKNTDQQLRRFEQTLSKIQQQQTLTVKKSTDIFEDLLQGQILLDVLREEITEFSDYEQERLDYYNAQARWWRFRTNDSLWVAALVGLLGASASWCLFVHLERELKTRETRLQESQAYNQAVVANAADGILTIDEDGNVQTLNRAAQQLFGVTLQPVKPLNFRQLIGEPVQSSTTTDPLNYFLATPSAKISCCQRETIGKRADGTLFPMDLAISEMLLADQRLFIAICRDITARRQAEETLRSQAQLLDLANDTIIVRDLNERITYWNQGARKLYGWRSKEVLGQEIHSLLQTQFPQPLAEIQQILQQQGYWSGELIHITREGQQVTVDSRWTLQRGEEGQPVAILELNNDVTDRQRWVKALHESQQMLRLVMDNIPQFVFWKDRNSVYLGCNDNVAWLLGLDSPADIVGKTDEDLPITQEIVERYQAQDRQVIETKLPMYHIVEQISLDLPGSQPIWVDANKVPLTDSAGNVIGILGTFEDITERKRAEAALSVSEQRFRATFEQAAVGMAQTTLNGEWLLLNEKLCQIVGYSRQELLKMRGFQEITHPEDLEKEVVYIRRLVSGEVNNYSLEKRYLRKDGSSIWVNITVSILHDVDNHQTLMGVVEDIQERKQAEEALRQRAEELTRTTTILARTTTNLKKRNQELDQFAYVVSHDLKAPLRAIANLSSWIEEDLEGQMTQDTQHQMNLLRGRVHRMEGLIEGLLQYSRVGRIKTATERVDLNQLLAEIVDSLAPPAGFTIEIPPNLPVFVTERLPLEQVFTNLISNAIKHNKQASGYVKISLRELEDFYEFAITDNGPGIAPQYHEKVFVIFQTLEARDKVENTGIGLSLVKKIVETHGGTIKLESQEGQGATFRFTWAKNPIVPPEL